jgi:hypothetical protein
MRNKHFYRKKGMNGKRNKHFRGRGGRMVREPNIFIGIAGK